MAESCVKFRSSASRNTINHLVIEYLKYILYYRGQFPQPLDQLKRNINVNEKSDTIKIEGNHTIYCDDDNQAKAPTSKCKKPNDRTKQTFMDSIKKFDEFFTQLMVILQNKDVLEIVMNLGPNMMCPKELHRITLPNFFPDSQHVTDSSSLQRLRLDFFKTLLNSDVLKDVKVENPVAISVLLRLKSCGSLSDHMELKRFYVPPQKCKQVLVRFEDTQENHSETTAELECFQNVTTSHTSQASDDLWVKLKAELKGFKSFIETQNSISSSSFF